MASVSALKAKVTQPLENDPMQVVERLQSVHIGTVNEQEELDVHSEPGSPMDEKQVEVPLSSDLPGVTFVHLNHHHLLLRKQPKPSELSRYQRIVPISRITTSSLMARRAGFSSVDLVQQMPSSSCSLLELFNQTQAVVPTTVPSGIGVKKSEFVTSLLTK